VRGRLGKLFPKKNSYTAKAVEKKIIQGSAFYYPGYILKNPSTIYCSNKKKTPAQPPKGEGKKIHAPENCLLMGIPEENQTG